MPIDFLIIKSKNYYFSYNLLPVSLSTRETGYIQPLLSTLFIHRKLSSMRYPSTVPLASLFFVIQTSLSLALPEVYERSPRRGGGGSSSSSSSSSGSSSLSIGGWFAKYKALIIGVGCAALVIIGLLLLFCVLQRRKSKKHYTLTQNPGNYKG